MPGLFTVLPPQRAGVFAIESEASRGIEIANDVHVLLRDPDDIDPTRGDFVEDQVSALRKAIIAGLYFRALFAKPCVCG